MTSFVEPSHTTAAAGRSQDRRSWRLAMGMKLNDLSASLRSATGIAKSVTGTIASLFESISLGLMSRSDVDEMVRRTYAARPGFYDPRRYRLPYEQSMLLELQTHRTDCRLLDAFCGQGREAELLAGAGYQVTGIDQLDWMIDAAKNYAREAGFDAEFLTADFSTFQPCQPFEIVYTSLWMLSTMQGGDRRVQFLQQCDRLCSAHGIAVVSYIDDAAESQRSQWIRFIVARVVARLTLGNSRVERGERIYTGLFWHHLSGAAVQREIQSTGWNVLSVLKGKGMEPTFLFLGREAAECAK